ncbi:TPA: hypothetical protein N0F65_011738 [Lagenidium giganteum]|uniref:Transposase n=1 Tax=Lagenidium giganteum TaxID=4803 RepID=A0AAV2YED6_9STRA|nr:TPA: hypothetical protein N0F65_011738 [Lagenidium giganteum]
MNPIENAWGVLARAVYKNGKQCETIEELQRAIVREWAAISASFFENLVSSMTNRCIELIKQRGKKTKY